MATTLTLGAAYRSHFQDSGYELEIPFSSPLTMEEWIAGMRNMSPDLTPEGHRKHKLEPPPPSILYRYPVDRNGKDWRGLFGFETHSFSILLSRLREDFERIKSHLA